jgi:hypothetical protein
MENPDFAPDALKLLSMTVSPGRKHLAFIRLAAEKVFTTVDAFQDKLTSRFDPPFHAVMGRSSSAIQMTVAVMALQCKEPIRLTELPFKAMAALTAINDAESCGKKVWISKQEEVSFMESLAFLILYV